MAIPYRTRRFLKNTLIFLLVLALLLACAWVIWMLWLDRYVVYTADGAVLDFSYSSKELAGQPAVPPGELPTVSIYYNEGDNALTTTLELLLQVFVDIIPIGPVLIQEGFKFLLILQHQVGKTAGGEGSCHCVNATGEGVDGKFQPLHGVPPSFTEINSFTILQQNSGKLNRKAVNFLFPTSYFAGCSI